MSTTTTRYWFTTAGAAVTVPAGSYWQASNATGTGRALTTVRPSDNTTAVTGMTGSYAGTYRYLQGIGPGTTLPARQLTGTFRAVGAPSEVFTSTDSYLYVTARVVSADGATVRGVLFSGTATAENGQPSTNYLPRTVSGPITPVTAQPGDRLVVEMGVTRAHSPGTNWPASRWVDPDATFANATTTYLHVPWVELVLDNPPEPPTAPTALAVTPGVEDLAVTWAAPVGGGPVAGYMVSIQDTSVAPVGTSYDVGLTLAHTLTGLDPATEYLVTVNAYGPGGGGPAVSTLATTLVSAAYRAVVRLGEHTWDVLAGDPPTLGPILPVSFGWAIPEDSLGFPDQPDPDLANLDLVTADHAALAGVDIGTTMRVSLYTTSSPTARPLATFRGRVADLEASPHPLGLSWRVLGVGYAADPGSRMVGLADWPQESGDARAARIMAEAGYPGWSAPAIGTTWEARQPAPVTARDALEALSAQAVTTEGTEFGPSRRVLVHPVTDADGELDPATPYKGAAVLARVDALDTVDAGLVNRATSWRRTKLLDATWVKIDHPGGPTVYGDPRGPAYPPQSAQVLDPRELADLVLDTTPGYRWLTGQPLRLELWAGDRDTLAMVAQWFYRDPASPPFPWAGRAVVVQGIARTPDGSDTYAGMLAAATMRLEASPTGGRLVVEFRLRPEIPAQSTVTMRWMDEPAGATWADELADDPTGTWYDYYTRPRP